MADCPLNHFPDFENSITACCTDCSRLFLQTQTIYVNNMINIYQGDLRYPIIFALERANYPLVELLIQYGADVNITDPRGNGLLHICIKNCVDKDDINKRLE